MYNAVKRQNDTTIYSGETTEANKLVHATVTLHNIGFTQIIIRLLTNMPELPTWEYCRHTLSLLHGM